jgi:hypothetical protein
LSSSKSIQFQRVKWADFINNFRMWSRLLSNSPILRIFPIIFCSPVKENLPHPWEIGGFSTLPTLNFQDWRFLFCIFLTSSLFIYSAPPSYDLWYGFPEMSICLLRNFSWLAKYSCRKHIEFTFIIKMEGTWKIIFFCHFPVIIACFSWLLQFFILSVKSSFRKGLGLQG